jgi:hypothetical protein
LMERLKSPHSNAAVTAKWPVGKSVSPAMAVVLLPAPKISSIFPSCFWIMHQRFVLLRHHRKTECGFCYAWCRSMLGGINKKLQIIGFNKWRFEKALRWVCLRESWELSEE